MPENSTRKKKPRIGFPISFSQRGRRLGDTRGRTKSPKSEGLASVFSKRKGGVPHSSEGEGQGLFGEKIGQDKCASFPGHLILRSGMKELWKVREGRSYLQTRQRQSWLFEKRKTIASGGHKRDLVRLEKKEKGTIVSLLERNFSAIRLRPRNQMGIGITRQTLEGGGFRYISYSIIERNRKKRRGRIRGSFIIFRERNPVEQLSQQIERVKGRERLGGLISKRRKGRKSQKSNLFFPENQKRTRPARR